MATEHYDVVVVGGGPAGSMAGAAAASQGAKTLILERDSTVGIPVRCGEGVAVYQLERFFSVEERYVAAHIKGFMLHSPDDTAVPVFGDELGLVLERTRFDRWLAERAVECGAMVRTRSEVDGLTSNNGAVKGISFTRMGKRYNIDADVVIAADGVDSRVARWAGFETHLKPVDIESAYQFLVAGIDEDPGYCHFFFSNDLAPGGYLWVFPKGDRIANIGIGIAAKYCDKGTAYRRLEEFTKHRYGSFSIIAEAAGGVPVAKPLKKPVKDGFIIAGDAARYTNPLTGGGIAAALITGNQAGMTAAQAIGSGDVSEKQLSDYVRNLEDIIIKPHHRAYKLKAGVFNLTDDIFNQTAHQVMSLPPEKRTIRNIFIKALATKPKLLVEVLRAFV